MKLRIVWHDKKIEISLFFIILASALINFIYLQQFSKTPFYTHLLTDEEAYYSKSLQIFKEGWLGNSIFYQAPFYIYFLAFIYKIFGPDISVVRWIQVFIYLLNILIIFFIGKNLFNKKIGLLSSVIVSLYGIFVFYNALILKVTLSVFFTSLLLLALLKTSKSPSYKNYFIAGLLAGLNITLRGNYFLVVPGIILWIFLYSSPWSLKIKNNLLFLMGAAILILPITLRNYYLEKDFVLITYQAGSNFFIGNNPLSNGRYTKLDFFEAHPEFEETDFRKKAEQTIGKNMKPSEISRFWFRQSLHAIQNDPLFFFKLFFKKISLFLNNYELPDNYDYYMAKPLTPVLKICFISFGLLLAFSIPGIYLCQEKSSSYWIFCIFLVTYSFSVVLFYVTARYRVPLVPALIPFASYFAIEGWKNFRKQNKMTLIFGNVIFLLFLYFIFKPVNILDRHISYYNLGTAYLKNNQLNESIAKFQEALKINPNFARAYSNLGIAQYQKGEYDEAIKHYSRALALKPDFADTHNNLGVVLSDQGKLDEAINHFSAALRIDPNFTDARYNLGIAYKKKGLIKKKR